MRSYSLPLYMSGAEGRIRTDTAFLPRDFKSLVSAYFTTSAYRKYILIIVLILRFFQKSGWDGWTRTNERKYFFNEFKARRLTNLATPQY